MKGAPWTAGQLRAFAQAACAPRLRQAIAEYDRLRSIGVEHEQAFIEAAGLDVNKLHDLRWWTG
jgi:hypothetical protein